MPKSKKKTKNPDYAEVKKSVFQTYSEYKSAQSKELAADQKLRQLISQRDRLEVLVTNADEKHSNAIDFTMETRDNWESAKVTLRDTPEYIYEDD